MGDPEDDEEEEEEKKKPEEDEEEEENDGEEQEVPWRVSGTPEVEREKGKEERGKSRSTIHAV
jgi:hypothetical protein